MEDINGLVNQIAMKQAYAQLRGCVIEIFENNQFFSDEELIAYTTDILKHGTKLEHAYLIAVWFKEWKASKEMK
jgi:hypothetical protein